MVPSVHFFVPREKKSDVLFKRQCIVSLFNNKTLYFDEFDKKN